MTACRNELVFDSSTVSCGVRSRFEICSDGSNQPLQPLNVDSSLAHILHQKLYWKMNPNKSRRLRPRVQKSWTDKEKGWHNWLPRYREKRHNMGNGVRARGGPGPMRPCIPCSACPSQASFTGNEKAANCLLCATPSPQKNGVDVAPSRDHVFRQTAEVLHSLSEHGRLLLTKKSAGFLVG